MTDPINFTPLDLNLLSRNYKDESIHSLQFTQAMKNVYIDMPTVTR